ncbi:Protein of unknown function [Planctomicrobium piriforme]|uniref:DUF1549 domain-containing protein n=2 Tax=Planctomicrobium piriforme TaxID=1576369 RepID=A0A1I3AZ89_9PLAN|nr:Protein of unknown function [Planctomicrobium piriforme]
MLLLSETNRNANACRPMLLGAVAIAALLVVAGQAIAAPPQTEFSTGLSDRVVQFVDQQIAQGWEDNDVKASPVASDAEWVRRVYLDIVGHIPPAAKAEAFIADTSPDKRSKLIDELLSDPDYVRNFTEVWTNTLIGRNTPDRTSRVGMRKFLREGFARNRPWNDIVYDLLTAEGHFEENGAVNFILAQLDGNPNSEEYHVEATAKTARIFLGLQVQCTQCHNHPFNEWKQNQFWEFNSFFRQARRQNHEKYDPASGRMVDDYSELVYRDFTGPVYYENRAGLVQVAYPTYMGTDVDREAVDRREELAKVICRTDPQHQLGRAMVNRMWGHYMGYGFTRPMDDMGPHNPESNPEIVDRLTEEFVARGYDLKQLARWICNTKAYNLTSQFNPKNEVDNPAAGEVPLFSHMYVKTMQAEQLYDSLLIATSADGGGEKLAGGEQERERWLRDFLRIFGGNEEDEPTLFSGSIPQALLMMNGGLVQKAISSEQGSYVKTVLTDPRHKNDMSRVEALYIAALGRTPERAEMTQLQKAMRAERDPVRAYQDLYWALLNSNEFIVNH